MQRLVPVGIVLSVASLYILRLIDPQNPLFELLTMSRSAMIFHGLVVALAGVIVVKGYFDSSAASFVSGALGLALALVGVSALFVLPSGMHFRPLDMLLSLGVGNMLLIASINPYKEEETQYDLQGADRMVFTLPEPKLKRNMRKLA